MDTKELYRYRTITEYSIKELINDEIVVSSLDTFNDPCDSTIVFTDVSYHEKINSLREVGKSISNQIGKDYFADPKVMWFSNLFFGGQFSSLIGNFKKHILVGCFTNENNNPVMWSHYSDNRKGFVIGYDEEVLKHSFSQNFNEYIFHNVDYDGQVFSVSQEIIDAINMFSIIGDGGAQVDQKGAQNYFNARLLSKDGFFEKAFTTKTEKWSYEEEVRYVTYVPESDGNVHRCIGHCKPKYIIIGDKVSQKDRYLLLSIARNKGIDVYELKVSYNDKHFGLVPVKLKNEYVDHYLKTGRYNIKFFGYHDDEEWPY